jgi:hypothetical protein
MLVLFLDFAEQHFNDVEYTDVTSRLRDVYSRTKEHEQLIHQHQWRPLARLVGRSGPTREELTEAYQRLCQDYSELHRDFFAVCMKRLPDGSATKEPFEQSVEVFLTELAGKW